MPQSKPIALVFMFGALIDLGVSIYFFIAGDDDIDLIVAVGCLFSAAILFFVGLGFMPGERGTSSSSRDNWDHTHSDWDSTDD
ncbi:MAG: hypothetical protein RIM84_01105 [Alphaproteobacteria bacterium]